ncbi:related to integral membrane protein pth11 [Claviceps purpurea 20.1]|uniref:Related to integral membrane protein pth11 n=1 Tax=Claviceps purpurea (strain 20.1) TaxID=1111077 RepID=M1VXE0_CLAP2|nr:related to integral membrane protein pth11 [Claviceps purpurea 20.1]
MAQTAYDLDESNASSLVITCIVMLVTSWIAVGLRAFTRVVLMKGYQADDILMLIAQVIFTVTCSIQFEGVQSGVGRHNAAFTNEDDLVTALMLQALGVAIYILNMMFIKLSIGVFLLRIATQKAYIWTIRIFLAIITLWSIGFFIWNLLQCTPIEKQWDFRITDGQCADAGEVLTAAYCLSAMTIVTDWFFALIPIPMLWRIKMSTQAKTTVIFILGIVRATDASIWSLIEVGVAIIASSLATVRPLLRVLRIRGFVSVDRSPLVETLEPRRESRKVSDYTIPEIDTYDFRLRGVGVPAQKDDEVDDDGTRYQYDSSSIDDYYSSIKDIGRGSARDSDSVADGKKSLTSSTRSIQRMGQFLDLLPDLEFQGREI